MFLHKTLQNDTQITGIAGICDIDNDVTSIAIAQGCNLNIVNPKNFQITQTYPFMSPIEVLAYEKYSQSTFILLRNYNWFIFKLPELIKTGSLFAPIFSSPHRSLLPRESDLTEPPAASTPVATAIIRFNESRILYAVHPHYIALRVQQSCIHVIPIEGNNEPFIIPILQSNIVDMAFLGPVSCSTRLSFISDSQTGDRLLSGYSLNDTSTEFSLEFTVNLPNNAHSLLPLHPELHSSIVVFTRDGVIRITAPEGLSQTVEHLSAFMPPYIVHHCHFFDDIYLICDSCGGLSGVSLPVEGTVTIESMKNVGPTSGIIAINKQHFFVASPFGDSHFYEFILLENSFLLKEIGVIHSKAIVSNLQELNGEIFCNSGRSNSSEINIFEKALNVKKEWNMNVGECVNIFCFLIGEKVFICLNYYNQTNLIECDIGSNNINNIYWSEIQNDKVTLMFEKIENELILYANDTKIVKFDEKMKILNKIENENVNLISNSNKYIIYTTNSNEVKVIKIKNFKLKVKFDIDDQILLIANDDNYIALYLINNFLALININDGSKVLKKLPLITLSSICFFNDNILLGTINGNIVYLTLDLEVERTIECSDFDVKLQKYQNEIISNGNPSFEIRGNIRYFYNLCTSEEIHKVTEDLILCLYKDELTLYRILPKSINGLLRSMFKVPDLLNFIILENNVVICLIEEDSKQYIIKYINFEENYRYEIQQSLTLFQHIKFEENDLIIIGYQSDYFIEILNIDLQVKCKQKLAKTPTSVSILNDLLIISIEGGTIEFYCIKNINETYEIERKMIIESHYITPTLYINENDYLFATDIYQSLFVYKIINNNNIIKVTEDNMAKGLNKIAVLNNNKIFTSDFKGSIYYYEFNENDGKLYEKGSFQLSSKVLSLIEFDNKIFYSTEGGGIGQLTECDDVLLMKVRDALDEENVVMLADTITPAMFEWKQENIFIDLDNLEVILKLPKRLINKIAQKVGMNRDELVNHLQKYL